jgi:hypothetical protein
VYEIDGMAASKEDAKIVTTNSTDSELNPTTTTTRIDP